MPCSDGGQAEYYARQAEEKRTKTHNTQLKTANERTNHLAACLCALLTELANKPGGAKLIEDAEKRGSVDITSFWQSHIKDDKANLKSQIKAKYSIHELSMLKDIIKEI